MEHTDEQREEVKIALQRLGEPKEWRMATADLAREIALRI
jgi:hypothetical protein